MCVKEKKKKKKRKIFFLFLILNFPPLTAVRLFSDAYRRRKRIERSDGTAHTKVSTASLSNIGSIPILLAFFSYFSLSPSYIYGRPSTIHFCEWGGDGAGPGGPISLHSAASSRRRPPTFRSIFFVCASSYKVFSNPKTSSMLCCALALCAKSK